MVLASPAYATFYCEVLEDGAPLQAEPSAEAETLLTVPAGAYVSLFDEADDKEGEWVRIAYDEAETGPWGAGISGWVQETRLDLCG